MRSCKFLIQNCQSLWHTKTLHVSAVLARKKKPFYNRYIKQYENNQIYTGYADEIIEKQKQRTLMLDEDEEDIDVEQEILSEGHRRLNAYKYKKLTKDETKGPGPRLLTWDQMEHARFLNQQSPEEWNEQTLAHSFQVPETVIRKILKCKRVLSPKEQAKVDVKARANQGFKVKLLDPSREKETTETQLAVRTDDELHPTSWGLPNWKSNGWFSDYEHIKLEKLEKPRHFPRRGNAEEKEVTWLEDDDMEFFSYLYTQSEEEEESVDESDHEDDERESINKLNDVNSEGNIFFNGDGEFLYKI